MQKGIRFKDDLEWGHCHTAGDGGYLLQWESRTRPLICHRDLLTLWIIPSLSEPHSHIATGCLKLPCDKNAKSKIATREKNVVLPDRL